MLEVGSLLQSLLYVHYRLLAAKGFSKFRAKGQVSI